ncbi:glycine/sarcosine/betaine reductase component B subunit [Fodinisporobacter ferrooxydans]|uniref:Glycine/sarcosine/betaine reductase component B subunit n=1 Tax=Fodinisporobacter ferrooxydans TaxID=2901836 RepID=A0ABY4CF62_9BACL|nr:glycine/sarcosine/betaine reductase component B subunit [Alicyclobacillaceae bacterium MYW30-H2]
MKLQINKFYVNDIQFAGKTEFRAGILTINYHELSDIALSLGYESVSLEIARPGENCRIVHIMDIVQPRWKPNRPFAYSGACGSVPYAAGENVTHVLDGMAIIQTGVTEGIQEGIIDMSGTGAKYSIFSQTINLVINGTFSRELTREEYDRMQRDCLFHISNYLAAATQAAMPDQIEEYDWKLVDQTNTELPRIGYVYHVQAQGSLRDTFVYGASARNTLPFFMSPLEVLDGAIQSGNYVIACNKNPTYLHVLNPIVTELLERHGRELHFVGIVVTTEYSNLIDKTRSATLVANMLGSLGADGAIVTKEGGGHADTDLMLVSEACNQHGIKTTLIVNESAGSNGDMPPLIDFHESADGIVTMGNNDAVIHLDTVSRVLGGDSLQGMAANPHDCLSLPLAKIYASTNPLGVSPMTCIEN